MTTSDTSDGTRPDRSPHTLSADEGENGDGERHHAFWADEVADAIEARDPEEPIVIKGGVSPSGIPHLGHANEILRAYFVAQVLRERGYEVRQVFTSDDRDPLRKLPRQLADTDWTIVGLGEVDAGALGRNLGKPYSAIPDPFGDCHDSYGAHFTDLLQSSTERLCVPVEMVSTTDLYTAGRLDDEVREVLEHVDRARELLAPFQAKVDDSYVPFNPICSACGMLSESVTAVDPESGTVEYVCADREVGDRTIEGCGHEGTAGFREGKLPWRFEWPAQWRTLGVDFEPFGKDHAEGSWPSGEAIATGLFGIDPPVPMVYEWFTLNGEALSSSSGNVVTVEELLALLEPEVVRYFFALDPKRARDLDLSTLDQLVDDFDRFERIALGRETADESLVAFTERAYPFVIEGTPTAEISPDDRIRLPYTFAAVLGMVEDPELREQLARDQGHVPADASDAAIEAALARVERARAWAERMDNAYNYRVQAELPDVSFDSGTEAALDDLAAFVEENHDGDAIQGAIYETAREHDIEVGEFFEAGYRLFFDDTQGPRLGEFLGELEREFVVDRLRRDR